MTSLRRIFVIGITALALVASATPSIGGKTRIRATDGNKWKPASKHVVPGTKVIWKNPSNRRHTVTAYKGGWNKSATVEPGERTSFRFNNEGSYKYRCTIHSELNDGNCSGMCGSIHVAG